MPENNTSLGFNQVVVALDALIGQRLEIELWSHDEDAPRLMHACGELGRIERPDDDDLAEAEQPEVESTVYVLGCAGFSLWPDRFTGASPYEREGLRIETVDAVITIARPQRAWID